MKAPPYQGVSGSFSGVSIGNPHNNNWQYSYMSMGSSIPVPSLADRLFQFDKRPLCVECGIQINLLMHNFCLISRLDHSTLGPTMQSEAYHHECFQNVAGKEIFERLASKKTTGEANLGVKLCISCNAHPTFNNSPYCQVCFLRFWK